MHIDQSTNGAAAPAGFKASQSYADAQFIRRAISKAKMNANRRDALRYIVNLWFTHRNNTGEIHPGVEKIAHKLRLSIRTIKSILKEFREAGFMAAIAYAKGGRKATRYRVDLDRMLEIIAPANVRSIDGDLSELAQERDEPEYADDGLEIRDEHSLSVCDFDAIPPSIGTHKPAGNRANFAHGYKHRIKSVFPSKEFKALVGFLASPMPVSVGGTQR
jgi:hypothetical protein